MLALAPGTARAEDGSRAYPWAAAVTGLAPGAALVVACGTAGSGLSPVWSVMVPLAVDVVLLAVWAVTVVRALAVLRRSAAGGPLWMITASRWCHLGFAVVVGVYLVLLIVNELPGGSRLGHRPDGAVGFVAAMVLLEAAVLLLGAALVRLRRGGAATQLVAGLLLSPALASAGWILAAGRILPGPGLLYLVGLAAFAVAYPFLQAVVWWTMAPSPAPAG